MEGLLALNRGSLGFDFGVGEAAVTLQPFVALVEQLFDFKVADLAQSVAQAALELRRHVLGVAVGAAWAPFCSVATWYIWRSLDPLPVEY